jgi:hypothetical protein
MDTKDIKSASLLGGCLVMAALIIALVPRPQVSVGRYEIRNIGSAVRNTYVIDTSTGRVWHLFDGKPRPIFAPASQVENDQRFGKPKAN